MRRLFYVIGIVIICCGLLPWQSVRAADSKRALSSPAELIGAINAYRASMGLSAYQTNSKLAVAAQAQSDYQASIETVTHTGPGGTRPRDRAYAVGYGDGNTVFVSEIIYGGYQTTINTAMSWWKTSSIHNESMLSPYSVDIGAGISVSGEWVYLTVVMGYVSGGTDSGTYNGEDVTAPIMNLVVPVVASDPQDDGSIVHVVRSGQSLWNIAAVYEVTIDTLRELNGLSAWDYLQIGQEILVQPATNEPTDSVIASPETETIATQETLTSTPSAVMTVTTTPKAAVTGTVPGLNTTQSGVPAGTDTAQAGAGMRWMLIIGLGGMMVVFIVLGFMQKKPARPER